MGGVVSAPVSVGSATSAQDISSHSARAVVYAKSDSESFPRALKVSRAVIRKLLVMGLVNGGMKSDAEHLIGLD